VCIPTLLCPFLYLGYNMAANILQDANATDYYKLTVFLLRPEVTQGFELLTLVFYGKLIVCLGVNK